MYMFSLNWVWTLFLINHTTTIICFHTHQCMSWTMWSALSLTHNFYHESLIKLVHKSYLFVWKTSHPRSELCPRCSKGSSLRGNLTTHLGNYHDLEEDKTPLEIQQLDQVRTEEKPFTCPHCGTGLSVKSNIQAHLNIHTESPPPM